MLNELLSESEVLDGKTENKGLSLISQPAAAKKKARKQCFNPYEIQESVYGQRICLSSRICQSSNREKKQRGFKSTTKYSRTVGIGNCEYKMMMKILLER